MITKKTIEVTFIEIEELKKYMQRSLEQGRLEIDHIDRDAVLDQTLVKKVTY